MTTTTARQPADAPALGDHPARPDGRRSARSRPRSAPASRRRAAPSRRSSRSSSTASPSASREIEAAKERGEQVWPVIDYADIAARHRPAGDARDAAPARLSRRPRPLRPRAGARLGPRHRRLRREQRLLRELPRAGRRLLRQRRLQARDLPDLLVARADGGPAERAHGHRAVLPQPPVEARVGRRARGSTPTATRSTPTASAAARRARLERPGHAPRPRHARPVDDAGLPAGLPAPVRRHASSSTTRGTPPTAPPGRSTRARRCARRSAPSRAGPPCPTWPTTRASCTRSRSPRRWPT